MNALEELYAQNFTFFPGEEWECPEGYEFVREEECGVVRKTIKRVFLPVKSELLKKVHKIKWAVIYFDGNPFREVDETGNRIDGAVCARLKSTRTQEDEEAFIETLAGIDYDNGYGIRYLYGTVVYDDYWLTRHEYDGSEYWETNSMPEEPDWDEK